MKILMPSRKFKEESPEGGHPTGRVEAYFLRDIKLNSHPNNSTQSRTSPSCPIDIGVETTATKINEDKDYWKKSVKDQNPSSYLVSPRLHVQKGLPFGFDIGLAVGQVLNPNITYAGGEVKYAILKGGALEPAVAVRGSYSQTIGVDQLDLKTYGLDLSVSKGFGVGVKIIPYGGGWTVLVFEQTQEPNVWFELE